jgi:four helix bundle protein
MVIQSAKDLIVYQKAYALAMAIYRFTLRFPPEERFALVSQIRKSSRSVAMNLREAWAKRRYEGHFVSKLTDCDGEANETDTSLDFARDCGFITADEHGELVAQNDEVRRMLGAILNNPGPFLLKCE